MIVIVAIIAPIIIVAIITPTVMVRSRCGTSLMLVLAGMLFVESLAGMTFVIIVHAGLHLGFHVRVRAGHVLAFHTLAFHAGTVCECDPGYEQSRHGSGCEKSFHRVSPVCV